MLHRISVSLMASLCLSSSIICVNAMDVELVPIKIESDFFPINKSPLSIEHIRNKLKLVNPGFNETIHARTQNCLPCAKVCYDWLSQQVESPKLAEDHIPGSANIWLNLRTAHFLPENNRATQELKYDWVQEDDLYVFSNPNDKNVVIIPEDDFGSARFIKSKFKKNQYSKIIQIEEYIERRFSGSKVKDKKLLTGIIYMDFVSKKNVFYDGHFVNFYTALEDSKYVTYIIDAQSNEISPLSSYINTYCGKTLSPPFFSRLQE